MSSQPEIMYAPDMYCAPQLYCRSTQNPRSRGNIGPFEGLVGGARMTGNHLCAVDPSSTIACWHEALFSVGTHDPHIDRALSCCPDSTKSLPPRPYCVQPYPPTTAVHGHRTQRRTTTRKKYGRGASWGGGCRFGARAPPSLLLLRPGTYSFDYCPLCYSIVFRCCTNPGSRSAMHTPPLCSSPHYFSASPRPVDLLPRSMI